MTRRSRRSAAQHASTVDVGLTSLVQLRATVGAVAALALADSAFATGRVTASCPTAAATSASIAPAVGASSPVVPSSQSDSGAARAAASFATLLFGPLLGDRTAYLDAVAGIADPTARLDLVTRADSARTALASRFGLDFTSGTLAVLRSVPLSWHVESRDKGTVRVRVWALGLLASAGRLDPTAVWSTGDYVVTWTAGGWRLVDVVDVVGVVPHSPQVPTSTGGPDPELTTFTAYDDVPSH